jgi:hypothetical protein
MTEVTEKMRNAFNQEVVIEDGWVVYLNEGLAAAIEAMDPAPSVSAFPEDLVTRLEEILNWRRTGVGELTALRAYAEEKLSEISETDVLRTAEDKTFMEAARLIVGRVRKKET